MAHNGHTAVIRHLTARQARLFSGTQPHTSATGGGERIVQSHTTLLNRRHYFLENKIRLITVRSKPYYFVFFVVVTVVVVVVVVVVEIVDVLLHLAVPIGVSCG